MAENSRSNDRAVPRITERSQIRPSGWTWCIAATRGRLFCAGAVILGLAVTLQAAEAPAQPDPAAQFGELMVEHWLTADVARQADRALFYNGTSSNASLASLRTSLADVEERLAEARVLFIKTKPEIQAAKSQLDQILDAIAAHERSNRRAAESLLQDVGSRTDPQFRAVPVPTSALRADLRNLHTPGFRPTRILFGSTAAPGDTRVAALKFDFCKGMFGFYAPMSGLGQLALPESLCLRTDSRYAWMRSAQVGYHYWAGVYNNQNTYVAPWFLSEHSQDSDIWMQLADGKILKATGDWGQLNVWNRSVQEYVKDYCAAQARALKNDPFLLCYDYTAEPHPWGNQPPNPPGLPQTSGYNASAVQAFRESLRAKFGSVERLNLEWRTNYADFNSIMPPPDPYVQRPAVATPLSYEFARFRCESHTRFWRMAYQAYRSVDPDKPVVANAGMFMSGWPVEALDTYQLQQATVADWIDMHMNNFSPNLPEQIYLYSLCRLTGKTPVMFEYIWTFPRTGPVDDSNEADFRATCEASVWRNLIWGKKVLVFFDVAYDWPAYHNAFLDRDAGYSILRPSACAIPLTKSKALRYNDLLLETEILSPPIVILQPTASVLNSPPVHPNQGFSFHTAAASALHKLLFPKNYPFLYVPEEAVLQDGYRLDQHKVVILPQAPYLTPRLTDLLLGWVAGGGTLIAAGLPGIWNPCGQDDSRLLTRVFGPSEVNDDKPGQWRWSWRLHAPNPGVEILRGNSNSVTLARAHLGKGTVVISAANYSGPELERAFYEAVDYAIGSRPARCHSDAFELVLRGDRSGRRYLCALNPDTRRPRQDEVIFDRAYRRCTDLGIGSGVPVSNLQEGKLARFQLRLEPGEGTIVALDE